MKCAQLNVPKIARSNSIGSLMNVSLNNHTLIGQYLYNVYINNKGKILNNTLNFRNGQVD